MPSDLEIIGLDNLAHLSRALRAAGGAGKGLRRELNSGINRETKQTRKEMRAAIVPGLPQSGGLAADVLRSTRFTTSTTSSGVRIRARGKRSIRRMNDSGSVRHRVFGRGPWVSQTAGIEKSFLDKPFEASRPELQRAVLLAIGRVRAQIYRSI